VPICAAITNTVAGIVVDGNGDLGLFDEYRLYFRPVVLGRGKPFFAGPRPPLRLVASDLIGEDAITVTYVPA
jgi:riboflavin biosynthesis pyrimidine reductase